MANYGNTASASGDYAGCDGLPRGIEITIGEDGNITSVWARVFEGTSNYEHTMRALIYDASDNFLGESDEIQTITTTGGWFEFPFTTPVAVSDTDVIQAYVWGNYTGNDLNIYRDSGTGYHDNNFPTYPTYSDPINPSSDGTAHYWGIYVEVTAAGGGGAVIFRRRVED